MSTTVRDHIQRSFMVAWSGWNDTSLILLAGIQTCPWCIHLIPCLKVTYNWVADTMTNQGKIWQNESEIAYVQLSGEQNRKERLIVAEDGLVWASVGREALGHVKAPFPYKEASSLHRTKDIFFHWFQQGYSLLHMWQLSLHDLTIFQVVFSYFLRNINLTILQQRHSKVSEWNSSCTTGQTQCCWEHHTHCQTHSLLRANSSKWPFLIQTVVS